MAVAQKGLMIQTLLRKAQKVLLTANAGRQVGCWYRGLLCPGWGSAGDSQVWVVLANPPVVTAWMSPADSPFLLCSRTLTPGGSRGQKTSCQSRQLNKCPVMRLLSYETSAPRFAAEFGSHSVSIQAKGRWQTARGHLLAET